MQPQTRLRLLAALVFGVGIAMAAAGGTMAAWAWVTPDVHVTFRIVMPLATAWLLFTLARLALRLPAALDAQDRAAPVAEEGGVSSVQDIALPGRVARRTIYADGRTHFSLRPAPRRAVTPRRAAAALVLVLAAAGAVAMLAPAGSGEWLAWLASD